MRLPEISIQRPVLATMMSLALVLFGTVALMRLPVRELPDIDPPIVNVTTVFPGANAELVETEVTERLEEEINSVQGIKTLLSESREQVSTITVEFDLSRDIELAAQDVRDRVARVRGKLPEDIKEPIVAKQDADAQPVLVVSIYSDRYSPLELTSIAENVLKDRLQTVKGVSSIYIGGQKRFAIRLWLDSEKMAARQITVLDIERSLRAQNVELPSGRVENLEREMTILVKGEMKTADEYNQMVVKEDAATLVRLQDVGQAKVGVEDERSIARYNGKPAVGLLVVKQSKANLIEVARDIRAEMEQLKPLLPAGVAVVVPYDESVFVEKAIHEVWITLGIAATLVVIVIFLFLRNVRTTLIPSVTIPVSIVATFAVLGLMGYSINILTMLALVLTIGIVVDDSIVVLENIYRHIEAGVPPREAAFKAMKEIAFAIVAITLSLVAVFTPLAFQTSITGRLFIEFAVALAGSVLISAFVALSLSPMMAARLLQPIHEVKHGRLFLAFERAFDWAKHHYRRALEWSLRHRGSVVVASLAACGLAAWFFVRLEKEFLPEEDKGRLFCITIAPEGSTSEYTDRMIRKMEGIVQATPEVKGYFSAVALARGSPGKASEGLMFIRLHEERDRNVRDIVNGPNSMGAQFFREVEGAIAIPVIPKAIGRSFTQSFELVLQYHDLRELNRYANELAGKLRNSGYLMNARSKFELTKPQLRLEIDRNRAGVLGVSIEDISRTLQILFGGLDLSKVKLGGKEYDVIAQLERGHRLTPSDLDRLHVRNNKGALIQLSSVVSYREGSGPSAIAHYNRLRSATVTATPVGVPLGTAVERVEELLRADLPPGFRYEWGGEAKDLKEAGTQIGFVIGLAIIIVYMVLASQFESLIHPFTVMLALPLAAIGAFGALWLMNQVNLLGTMLYGWAHFSPDPPAYAHWLSTLVPRIPAMNINLFSQIGIVLLLGLVTKNSILLVEFANQRIQEGKPAAAAMLEAGTIRLRPILMTALSTIAGILPIAIGFGAGAESRRPMGVAAIGGMITSTFLTLFVIPVVYTVFADLAARFRRKSGKPAALLVLAGLGLWPLATLQAEEKAAAAAPASEETYDLSRCMETALKKNFDILKATERIRKQQGVVVEVRARLLPHVTASGTFDQVDPERLQSFGGGFAPKQNSWVTEVTVNQVLFAGGRNDAARQREQFLEQAALVELQSVVNTVLLQVRERYFDALLAQSQILVQEQNVQLLEEELKIAQNKFKAGAVPEFNVLRAEVALANGRPPLIRARNNLRLAVEELARVLGLRSADADAPGLKLRGEWTFEPYEMGLAQALASAQKNRPELQRFSKLIAAQQQTLREAKSGYLPEISAFASYGAEKERFSPRLADELHGWTAGVRARWEIFDGLATQGRITQARSAVKLATLEEAQARLDVEVEVRRAHSSLGEAVELVNASREVVKQAEESLRQARARYDVGAATQLDVLDSQVALTQARTNQIEALHDYSVARARFDKAVGAAARYKLSAP